MSLFNRKKKEEKPVNPKGAGRKPRDGMGSSVHISNIPELTDTLSENTMQTVKEYLHSNPVLLKGENVAWLEVAKGLDIDLVGRTNDDVLVIVKIKKDVLRSNVVVGRNILEKYADLQKLQLGKEDESKVKIILVRITGKGLYQNVWVV